MLEQNLEYRNQNRVLFISLAIGFAFSLYLFIGWALDPNHVVKIKHLTLGRTAGLIFLYFGALFSAAMALFGLVGVVSTFISRKVVIGNGGLKIPKNPLSINYVELKYSDILGYKVEQTQKIRTLVIKHSSGVVRAPETSFPKSGSFETLCRVVSGNKEPSVSDDSPQPAQVTSKNHSMQENLSRVLLKTREGLIFVVASLIYLAVGIAAKFSPSIASIFGFVGFMALYMPIVLLLLFLKIRGYRKDYQTDWFNTGVMLIGALVPVILVAKSAFFH